MEVNGEFANFVYNAFNRYVHRDWGDTCSEDCVSNNMALELGERIFAVYKYPGHREWTIWIITEWDRSCTTILFPSEY